MVIVSNDSVIAYIGGEEVFDFGGQDSENVLYDVLTALNIDVQFA